jgi:hypothetical protein
MHQTLLWHTGDCPGFDSYAGRFINDNTYIVILSNNQYNVQGMKDQVGHILYNSPAYFADQKTMLNQQLSSAQNELERRRAIWQLDEIKGMESTDKQPPSVLAAYAGTFAGIDFFVRGNLLCCRNFSRDNNLLRLKHISGDLYQLDEDVQVEFEKDQTGHAIGVKVMGRGGYEGYWPIKSEQEKNKAKWRENKERAGEQTMPDSTVLASYAGTYEGGLQFYQQDTGFFCKNAERGNSIFKLRYISGSLFQMDDEVQVQFVKGNNGNVTSIKMLWDEGVETVKYKER